MQHDVHNTSQVYSDSTKRKSNPNLKTVYYLSESPTSQYRNKTIFQFIANHEAEFGISGRWGYLESGHGKCPCDGLGASVRRAADNAVKQGKTSIQCSEDFLKLAGTAVEAGSKVNFLSFTQADYKESEEILLKRVTQLPVKGTLKKHYVIGDGPNKVFTSELTCYCDNCRADVNQTKCEGYTLHFLTKNSEQQNNIVETNGKEVLKKIFFVSPSLYPTLIFVTSVTIEVHYAHCDFQKNC